MTISRSAAAFRAPLLLMVALAGCSPAGAPSATPTPMAPGTTEAGAGAESEGGRIAFDIASWGKPLGSWEIAPDGTGSYSESEQIGGDFLRYRITRRALKAGPEGYAEIRALLAPAERFAGKEIPCRLEITDQPYGKLVWRRAAGDVSVAFNYGCRSEETARIFPAIEKANARIKMWSRDGAVIDTRQVDPPR